MNCTKHLCPFEHVEEIATKESEEANDEEEHTYGDTDCHLCTNKFQCVDDLVEHFKSAHEDYFNKMVLAAQTRRNEIHC